MFWPMVALMSTCKYGGYCTLDVLRKACRLVDSVKTDLVRGRQLYSIANEMR